MPLLISYALLLVGNWYLAEWAIPDDANIWPKIIFGIPIYLYIPVGAFYYIAQHDPFEIDIDKKIARFVWFLYVAYPLYWGFIAMIDPINTHSAEVLFAIPILIGIPVSIIVLIAGVLFSPLFFGSFWRAVVGSTVSLHPAHSIIMSGNVITPPQAASLASDIQEALSRSYSSSTLELDIRNHRAESLLERLRSKVDYAAEQNRIREAKREAEIERRTRPERERLAAQVRAAQLDAELAEKMVELIRENERRKYREENP
jgi:hypothetical protein